MAQQRQAPATASGPHGTPNSGRPSQEITTPPMVMQAIPKAIRRSEFSLKTYHASSAVNTPSRFNKREADDEGVAAMPNMSSAGPTTPPKKTAPPSHGKSERLSAASLLDCCLQRISHQTDKPRPDPRYRR